MKISISRFNNQETIKTSKLRVQSPISANTGFTLIELMTVIMTMALLFALGYANYRDFQRRQVLEGVVREFKSDLRLAQQLALAGKKEAGCTTLTGYRMRRIDEKNYEIVASCGGHETCLSHPSYCIKEVSLPPNILAGPFPMPGNRFLFKVLAGGIDRTSDVNIQFRYEVDGNVLETRNVVITTVGEIY